MIARILRALTVLELIAAGAIAAALHDHAQWPWIAAAMLGIATPLASHAGIVATGFVLSSSHVAARDRLGAAACARLYLREVWSSFRAFQVEFAWLTGRRLPGTAAAARPTPASARPADGPLPVLLLHGYFCNRQIWHSMASALAARGHAIEAIDLEPAFGSIDEYAAPIDAALRRLRERTGAPRVALVCHSMGGLAARAYLRAFGADAVAGLVTLGSPHRGTVHARFAMGTNAAQMRFASPWLDALAAAEPAAVRASMTIVLTLHDNIVCPQAVQTLPGAAVIELSGLGHLAMVHDRGVQRVVADALARIRGGSPASPAGTRPGPP